MMFKKIIQEWYLLNKTQRRGTVILMFLFLIAVFFKIFYKPTLDNEVIYFANIQLDNKSEPNHLNPSDNIQQKDSLFFFNPNIIGEIEMKQLGLPENIIHNIIKYREAGGKFFTKESIKKIYGMNDSVYQKLDPYIIIENHITQQTPKANNSNTNTQKFKIPIIELNAADSIQLKALKGIGKILSVRIVKYRNRLGGFYSIEQLKEVYGISENLYNTIIQNNTIKIDTLLIKKININMADFKTMIRHPYFNKELVVSILNLQKKKEPVTKEKLKELADEPTRNKLIHYIEF